jgi:hypothetical protein
VASSLLFTEITEITEITESNLSDYVGNLSKLKTYQIAKKLIEIIGKIKVFYQMI